MLIEYACKLGSSVQCGEIVVLIPVDKAKELTYLAKVTLKDPIVDAYAQVVGNFTKIIYRIKADDLIPVMK